MPTLKQRAPQGIKVWGRRASVSVGRRTAALRMTPSFLLIGGQRCGTTSLFRALLDHPSILQPVHHKGVNYFDVNYDKGADWFAAHFPLRAVAALRTRGSGHPPMTFDASGYYSFHPLAAERIVRDLPDIKIMMMLRDPVERAYSAYKHEVARGFETESFERALELEDSRLEPEQARMAREPHYFSFSHRHHGYRRRGQYAEQLQRFIGPLGRDRVLVVDSADFFGTPAAQYRRIIEFLELPEHTPASFERWNARPGSPISAQARDFLDAALAPHDDALAEILGEVPSWRR